MSLINSRYNANVFPANGGFELELGPGNSTGGIGLSWQQGNPVGWPLSYGRKKKSKKSKKSKKKSKKSKKKSKKI